ncbi:electron transport complex subunit RsxG [Colwellia sp. BRX8-4]|uniref:electron transport complex subunit RsxG n=1 Tax=Colwellia sp. BRX8-4 TaxID=2759836 RepID=UPI0015F72350|nr:electron transport complex subunit RsxG [Colwellia sp. BRX8-4]MBA6362904.1 electron transport complex subunit RsxG [Colwellia sp. BRX8-8]MBA6373052.1 electron transport complex subunit RsxG [Colwellia sp. BRX8-4]
MVLSLTSAVSKNARILALFAIACTAIVGVVHSLTKDQIILQQQQDLLRNLNSIIAKNSYNNVIYKDCFILPNEALGTVNPPKVYRARNNNSPVAAAITTVAPDGYSGNIELIVAINIDGSISGVRTLKHQETPGLGDKIEEKKSDWINSFTGKKLIDKNDNRWLVRKDGGMFDQFTGATITPRAVVKAVRKSVNYFNAHQDELFEAASNCSNQDVAKGA